MREKIIEKSNELFLNFGFKSVTMDEIANSLGISKKTLYKHFSNKTTLIDAVTHYMFDTICCSIDTVCEQKMNPINEMFQIKKVVMEHLKDEKSSPLYQLQKYYPPIYASLKEKQFYMVQKTIQDNLQRGVTSGLFRTTIDIDFTSRIYFNGMVGIKDQQLFPLKKYSMNTLMNYYLEYHLRAISTLKGLTQLEYQLKNNPI
jgi:AcrR family transcriptional regulator